jgi:hypothetical protein
MSSSQHPRQESPSDTETPDSVEACVLCVSERKGSFNLVASISLNLIRFNVICIIVVCDVVLSGNV